MKHVHALYVPLLLVVAAACAQAPKDFQPAQLRDFPRGTLDIERAHGRDNLRIWIADTYARQLQGLMWIRELPPDYAMLFPVDPPAQFNLWMKNTYVSLDMLFFDSQGHITHIHERATPLSEDIIESGASVAGVIEVLGGEVARRGIKLGDRVVIHGPGN